MNAKIFDKKMIFAISAVVLCYILMAIFGPYDSLDRKFYYTGSEARELLQIFSASDLKAYSVNQYIDLCLIISYTSAFLFAFNRLYEKKVMVLFLPLFAALFDFIETLFIIGVLDYSVSQSIFDWLGVVTLSKWVFCIICLLLLLVNVRKSKKYS